ncbi:ShlB/FhaC/HecB family hemolysin secretion/activation protein [Trinickia dinghuensis]|uniref:ShlB/FhaC/HecB family hemolysin secretion/activation protein n=1 Tax=Trinickia dinghuensis TaxID=2291023 RepID=A0A3D8JS28_9BURK|nr:POTRA domain-containing protein [Trinickia dinghuensis]RDU95221.1 ShlB/FhaC/HecB family hemolysin secretion/activation protein [Trinickia dinghuensis]
MKIPTFRIRFAGLWVPALLSAAAHAQSLPPIDAGKALQETKPALPPAEKQAPEPVIEQPEEPPLALPANQTLTVKAFRFEGAEFIPETDLQTAVASYKGRALSMADIEAAADRVTALYRSRGYLVARAYVPRQDANGGVLTLRVVVGKYGKVSIRNRSRVRDRQVEGDFSGLRGNQAVTREALERAMLLVGDLPGATLPTVSISPGQAPGTSDFDVAVGPGKRYGGYATFDNYGSRYTGDYRFSVGASLYSPFGLGDSLNFTGMSSTNAGLYDGRLAYSAPLGTSGLRGELAIGSTRYKLGDAFAPLDAQGYANSLEANFSYPIVRTRSQNLTATVNLVGRDMRDELGSVNQVTTRHLYAGTFGLTHERYGQLFGRNAYLTLTGGLTVGRLDIAEPAMKAANEAGADTVGGYGRADFSILGRLAVTDTLSASASLNLQRAIHRNLDSSEQLLISGTQGVLAYQEAGSGDNGYLANVNLRYALPRFAGVDHSVSVFADSAHVGLHDASYTTTDGATLQDVGIGYTASYRWLFARLLVAHAVGAMPASVPTHGRNRFLAQVAAQF